MAPRSVSTMRSLSAFGCGFTFRIFPTTILSSAAPEAWMRSTAGPDSEMRAANSCGVCLSFTYSFSQPYETRRFMCLRCGFGGQHDGADVFDAEIHLR